MDFTENYKLKKPSADDFANIADLNTNADIIDEKMKKTADCLAAKADKSEIPTTLPANGGNADTVNGYTVNADVPENAEFTDTTYSNMQGATETSAGKSGLVPTPPAGASKCYLGAFGGWDNPFTPTTIQTAGTDLNTYVTSGVYFFNSDCTPLNCPPSINGWLLVMSAPGSTGIKQVWWRFGTNNTNDYQTFVRTKNSGYWSNWQKLATVPAEVSPLQIVNIVQGSLSRSSAAATDYLPYQSGATKALVEVWNDKVTVISASAPHIGRTVYCSRYMTGISSSMTAITPTTIMNMNELDISVGTDKNGRILFSSTTSFNYRVTWLV